MLTSVFATKLGMTQAWTQSGKRLPVTKCKAEVHRLVAVREERVRDKTTLTPELITIKQAVIGYGERPLKQLTKPLQGTITKQGFSNGAKHFASIRLVADAEVALQPGSTISLSSQLEAGDVVQVQGTSKGRGYAGVVKRHGFHGGPATHGQSDRHRAPGAIGQRTTPGRVFRNQRMAGHYGVEAKTVTGLVVLRVDDQTGEIWLSGPVPGSISSLLKITKMGTKKHIPLHDDVDSAQETEVADTQSAADVVESDQAEEAGEQTETVDAEEAPMSDEQPSETTAETTPEEK